MRKVVLTVLLCVLPFSLEAGIVVLESGKVYIAKIKSDEITDEFVTMRWPYKNYKAPDIDVDRGVWKIERRRIRWFDPDSDSLTDDYFKKHLNAPLDPRFEGQKVIYEPVEDGLIPEVAEALMKRPQRLRSVRIRRAGCEFSPPEGWERKDQERICTLVADEKSNGYAARIHVSSVIRPKVSMADQIDWLQQEIKKVDEHGKLIVRESVRETVRGGSSKNFTMTTVTRRKGKPIVVRRFVLFRKERVYFVSCYASQEEYKQRLRLFEAFMKSLTVLEGD